MLIQYPQQQQNNYRSLPDEKKVGILANAFKSGTPTPADRAMYKNLTPHEQAIFQQIVPA